MGVGPVFAGADVDDEGDVEGSENTCDLPLTLYGTIGGTLPEFDVLYDINQATAQSTLLGSMGTLWGCPALAMDPASGHLDHVCAGHPFPMVRRVDGSLAKLGSGSFPLGLRTELRLEAAEARLGPGDLLLLYTDGIPEAVDENGEAFGFERLERSFAAGGAPQQVHDRILNDLADFEGDQKLRDDRSLVVMARQG